MKLPNFAMHMPKDWIDHPKHRERGFFYGVVCTINAQWVEDFVADCRQQRRQPALDRLGVERPLPIAQSWVDRLLSVPYVSSKCSFPYS